MTQIASLPQPSPARWRGLTVACSGCGAAILSFVLEDGTVLRLLVSAQTQFDLSAVLLAQRRSDCACGACAARADAIPAALREG